MWVGRRKQAFFLVCSVLLCIGCFTLLSWSWACYLKGSALHDLQWILDKERLPSLFPTFKMVNVFENDFLNA